MKSVIYPLVRLAGMAIGFGTLLSSQPLPRPLPIYFLEFKTDIKGESHSVADDITRSLEIAFSSRRRTFDLIDKRNLGEIGQQIALNLQEGKRPTDALIRKGAAAYGFIRGELVTREDGVELRVSMVGLDSRILWAQQKTHTLNKWKDGELRSSDAQWLAADAEAQLFPAEPAQTGNDAALGIDAARAGDCRKSMPYLENASSIDPENAGVYLWLARCHNREGRYEAAGSSATQGLSHRQQPELFVERAVSLLARQQYASAIADSDRALKLDPENTRAFEVKGDALMRQGHYSEAVNNFSAAYERSPGKDNCMKLADAYRRDNTAKNAEAVEAQCRSLR